MKNSRIQIQKLNLVVQKNEVRLLTGLLSNQPEHQLHKK
jgi:hypothetical protein